MWIPALRKVLFFTFTLCSQPYLDSERRDAHFVLPNAWANVSSSVMPVLARLPMGYRWHTASLLVDGQSVGAAPVVVRRRWWEGKGVDLMASVDVSQLAPGWHILEAVIQPSDIGDNRKRTAQTDQTRRISARFRLLPRQHRVSFHVVDEDGAPRYGRVLFMIGNDSLDVGNPYDGLSDPSRRDVPRTSLFVSPKGATEFLDSGQYRVVGSGGIRDGIDVRDLDVSEPTTVTLTVPRRIRTNGEVTADLHVHTAMSSDAFIADTQRFQALASADVDVAVISDHNRMRDPKSALELLEMVGDVEAITGVEFRIGPSGESIGHGNAFPLKPGVRALKPKDKTPGEVFNAWREHHRDHPIDGDDTPVLIQLNHPRGIQFRPNRPHRTDAHALFDEVAFDPSLPLAQQSDERVRKHLKSKNKRFTSFDAIEVLNRFSVDGWLAVRRDWFSLLNRGYRITGTGNSDSHTVALEPVGFPVNLVRRRDASVSSFVEAIRNGEVRVSSGPLVSLWAETDGWRETSSHALHSLSGAVRVTIRVEAVDWVTVDEVRLVMNGRTIFRDTVGDGPVDRTWTLDLDPKIDAWILAEAGHPLEALERPEGTEYSTVAPGHVPIGFTNPIWLDRDGDGRFSATEEPEGRGLQ